MRKWPRGDDLVKQKLCLPNLNLGVVCEDCPWGHPDLCHYPLRCNEVPCRYWAKYQEVGWGGDNNDDR